MKIYIVGGAVRDELLGLTPKDIDYVVVGSTPEEMLALGYEQVGADFPVFLHPETKDEYALARTERKTGPGYHGFEVSADPTVTLQDDLSRRDLTINAMAKDVETGDIYDPHGGQHDLKYKVLRHVSPAFAEDPLRVIRLARFAARYFGFTIASSTMDLAIEMVEKGELGQLPDERFWAEMEKALISPNSGHFFWVLDDLGVFNHVSFFNELFGSGDMSIGDGFARSMAMNTITIHLDGKPAEDRLMLFTALMAQHSRKRIWSAPVRTQKLYNNVWNMRAQTEATVDVIFDILQKAKFWSQATEFDDLLSAMIVMSKMYEPLIIDPRHLNEIAHATKAVSAADFPDFSGKELGEKIKEGRKQLIAINL